MSVRFVGLVLTGAAAAGAGRVKGDVVGSVGVGRLAASGSATAAGGVRSITGPDVGAEKWNRAASPRPKVSRASSPTR